MSENAKKTVTRLIELGSLLVCLATAYIIDHWRMPGLLVCLPLYVIAYATGAMKEGLRPRDDEGEDRG